MKKWNINELIWFGILVAFSIYLLNLIVSGSILHFIHPKMVKFAIGSFSVFLFLAIYQVLVLINGRSSKELRLGYLLFILPLLFGFALEPQGLDESITMRRSTTIASANHLNESFIFSSNVDPVELLLTDDVLVIDETNFDGALKQVKNDLEQYSGTRVSISGFIDLQTHDQAISNSFIISRLLVTCCAADALPIGLLTTYEGVEDWEEYSWIHVIGTIEQVLYFDPWTNTEYIAPLIHIEYIEEIDRPDVIYVYPSS